MTKFHVALHLMQYPTFFQDNFSPTYSSYSIVLYHNRTYPQIPTASAPHHYGLLRAPSSPPTNAGRGRGPRLFVLLDAERWTPAKLEKLISGLPWKTPGCLQKSYAPGCLAGCDDVTAMNSAFLWTSYECSVTAITPSYGYDMSEVWVWWLPQHKAPSSYGCFYSINWAVPFFVGVLVIRGLLFGVYIGARDFWKLSYEPWSLWGQ